MSGCGPVPRSRRCVGCREGCLFGLFDIRTAAAPVLVEYSSVGLESMRDLWRRRLRPSPDHAAVARLPVPGKQDIFIPITILLGIIGLLVGGFLGYLVFRKDSQAGLF